MFLHRKVIGLAVLKLLTHYKLHYLTVLPRTNHSVMVEEVFIHFLCHSSPGFEQRHCVHRTMETSRLKIRCYTIDNDFLRGGGTRFRWNNCKSWWQRKGSRCMHFWSVSVNLTGPGVLVILCRADLMSELTAKGEGAADPSRLRHEIRWFIQDSWKPRSASERSQAFLADIGALIEEDMFALGHD